MSRNSENNSPSCSSPEGLVSYIYGEMPRLEQATFEDHLGTCETCAAELAELSLSRLSVYEWHRDEFAPLATPRITVPYHEAVRVTWFDAVRAFFTGPVRSGMAVAAAALLLISLAGAAWLLSPRSQEIATQAEHSAPGASDETPQMETAATGRSQIEVETTQPVHIPARPEQLKRSAISVAAARPAVRMSKRMPKQQPAAETVAQVSRTSSGPRLNNFVDEEDNTLRLGDLLAEVDIRK